MALSFSLNSIKYSTNHIAALAGATFGLSQFGFTQELNPAFSEHEDIIRSAQANASINNIPVYFAGFGEAKNQKDFYSIRIRGELAHALYDKGAFLILMYKSNPLDYTHTYSGEGSVFCKDASGKINSQSFSISPFSFGNAMKSYKEYMEYPESGDHKIVSFHYGETTSSDNSETARLLRDAMINSVSEVMQVPKLSAEPIEASYSQYYFSRLKELAQEEAIGLFISLKDFPAVNAYAIDFLAPELERFNQLSNATVPKFLESRCQKFTQALKEVAWLTPSSIARYSAASWNTFHPDDESIPNNGNGSEAMLLSAIQNGVNVELRDIRKMASDLEKSVDMLKEQKETFESSKLSIYKLFKSTAITDELKIKFNAALSTLELAANDSPNEFRNGFQTFQTQTSEMNIELARLEAAYAIAEKRRKEAEIKAAEIQRKEEEHRKFWETVKAYAIGIPVTIGAIIVGIIGLFASGGSVSPIGATSRDSDSEPARNPYPDDLYEPYWKRQGMSDPQSNSD